MSAATLVQQLIELAEAIFAGATYEELHEDDEVLSPESLAIIAAAIADCRTQLAYLYRLVEADLMENAGEKRFQVPGLGEVEIRRSITRNQWDNEDLTRHLVALALDERIVDERTGEYEPAHEAVARVLSECARPSWRVMPLRARGIQIDEFCHEEDASYSVKLPGHRPLSNPRP